jgi:hypothetical protein
MDNDQARLSDRITNAEDWLARARRQLERGETARGTLTLLLAEAEVHRARELGMETEPARPALPWPLAAVGVLTVAALAAAIWVAGVRPAESPHLSADTMPQTIVMLSGGNGSLLELVQTRHAAEPEIDERQIPVRVKVIHVPVRQIVTVPAALTVDPVLVVSRPVVKPEPASVAVAAPAPPVTSAEPAPAAVQPAPPVVSDANLIDLVLAAERSLRKANQ